MTSSALASGQESDLVIDSCPAHCQERLPSICCPACTRESVSKQGSMKTMGLRPTLASRAGEMRRARPMDDIRYMRGVHHVQSQTTQSFRMSPAVIHGIAVALLRRFLPDGDTRRTCFGTAISCNCNLSSPLFFLYHNSLLHTVMYRCTYIIILPEQYTVSGLHNILSRISVSMDYFN